MSLHRLLIVPLFALAVQGAAAFPLLDTEPGEPAFAITGNFAGMAEGQTAYLPLSTMLEHPDIFTTEEPFSINERVAKLTCLPFRSILDGLPRGEGADAVIIECRDGWLNYYTEEILDRFEPFVVLLIDGEPPGSWPIGEAMREHLYPFYIHISVVSKPEFYSDMEFGMMNPSAASTIRAVNFDAYFEPLRSGAYAAIKPGSPEGKGRTRFLNNCMACHTGPGGVGGTKSDRPFAVLKAHARYNPAYLKDYVRDPRKINPATKMMPHPHFNEKELNEIIAFLKLGEL